VFANVYSEITELFEVNADRDHLSQIYNTSKMPTVVVSNQWYIKSYHYYTEHKALALDFEHYFKDDVNSPPKFDLSPNGDKLIVVHGNTLHVFIKGESMSKPSCVMDFEYRVNVAKFISDENFIVGTGDDARIYKMVKSGDEWSPVQLHVLEPMFTYDEAFCSYIVSTCDGRDIEVWSNGRKNHLYKYIPSLDKYLLSGCPSN
jgi:hypothetical protein